MTILDVKVYPEASHRTWATSRVCVPFGARLCMRSGSWTSSPSPRPASWRTPSWTWTPSRRARRRGRASTGSWKRREQVDELPAQHLPAVARTTRVLLLVRLEARVHERQAGARRRGRGREGHPDVGPVQGWNPLGLRFLRRFRLARTVEGDRPANERLEGALVNFFSFVDVDRTAYVSVETRVEETGRIPQRRALREGKLHDVLVGFASADDAVVRPNRGARGRGLHPLPLLDNVR